MRWQRGTTSLRSQLSCTTSLPHRTLWQSTIKAELWVCWSVEPRKGREEIYRHMNSVQRDSKGRIDSEPILCSNPMHKVILLSSIRVKDYLTDIRLFDFRQTWLEDQRKDSRMIWFHWIGRLLAHHRIKVYYWAKSKIRMPKMMERICSMRSSEMISMLEFMSERYSNWDWVSVRERVKWCIVIDPFYLN